MGVLEFLVANPYDALAAVQIALLLAASLLLIYPVVAYARNVAYTTGFVGLTTGFLLLTISNTFGLLIDAGVIAHGIEDSSGVRSIMNLGGSVAATIGIYDFAKQFIQTDSDGFEPSESESQGGFDDAD